MFGYWEVNLLFYLVSAVLFTQFYKLSVNNVKNDGAATILLQLLAGTSILLFIPFDRFEFSFDFRIWGLLIAACVFYALQDRIQTTTRRKLEVSENSILGQMSNVFLIIYGILIFREGVVAGKILGAVLIVIGNMLVLYKDRKLRLNKYSFLALFSTFVFATAISIDVGISKNFNLPVYIALTLIIPALMILIVEKLSIQNVLSEYRNGNKVFFLVAGLFWGLTIFFSLRSFQLGEVTVIAPLQATNVLLNVLIAFPLQKEKDRKLRKVFAAALIILGIYLTVVAVN